MLRLELDEHSELAVDLNDAQLDQLIAAAGGRLAVRRVAGGRHVLSSGSHVGVLVADGLQVVVQPKVPLHNLFLMLGVGSPDFATSIAMYGLDDDLLAAMVRLFAESVETATVRGVMHGYQHTEERLVALRGRIDVAAQARRPGLPSPISCRFDEFTDDIFENRVLLAALDRLRRVPGLRLDLRSRLEHLGKRLSKVRLVAVDPARIDEWRPNRLNRHYEVALRLAAVILRNVTLRNSDGAIAAPAFMINMNDLFQDFVLDRLRTTLRGHLEVVDEPTVHLGVPRRLAMRPDLVFRRGGAHRHSPAIYVADTKYKLSSGAARMSDYYQLLAYTTSLGLDEGVLIYAQRPAAAPTEAMLDDLIDDQLGTEMVHTVHVRNTSTSLHVYRLPLAGSNADVEAELASLAGWLGHRADYAQRHSGAFART